MAEDAFVAPRDVVFQSLLDFQAAPLGTTRVHARDEVPRVRLCQGRPGRDDAAVPNHCVPHRVQAHARRAAGPDAHHEQRHDLER